jgi:hypothetical protein
MTRRASYGQVKSQVLTALGRIARDGEALEFWWQADDGEWCLSDTRASGVVFGSQLVAHTGLSGKQVHKVLTQCARARRRPPEVERSSRRLAHDGTYEVGWRLTAYGARYYGGENGAVKVHQVSTGEGSEGQADQE